MSQSTESTTESNPFTKPGFIIAAALVVALIAATIVIFLLPKGQGNTQPAPAPVESSSSASPSASAEGGSSVCGLPSSSETALGSAPDTNWELVGKMATPTEPDTFGPGTTDEDGFRSCFSQTPTGALYAAANLLAMGSSGDRAINQKLTGRLLLPGPGRDIAKAESQAMPATAAPSSTVQFRGFVIKSYSGSAANVDIAFQTDTGVLGHTVLPLEWVDGDWKLAIADSGRLVNDITQIRDLSGFIPWSGA
ncbi:hypothetical protein J2X12_003911 [Pseudarthrobacter oxydans]|uniref:DUF8175 domain-containing protein n=1 Tax=Pseudarthrobacter oxydans TaxID=1671 RepID=A0AAW8NIC4_PSEOX|nr:MULTISPECIES: hypothetical protein [Micrococcaceae]MDR7165857.1 hypothetical protein [Pseudarthrobacter oxydans]TNB67680.1 hypothetical protein FHJ30_20460 [Arthrobacter sp. BB-1]